MALWRQPAIEVSVIVDERSAGFFALGAAQATRLPVGVLCTSGTAAANLFYLTMTLEYFFVVALLAVSGAALFAPEPAPAARTASVGSLA